MEISGYNELVSEFGSSLIEKEVSFDEIKLTAHYIREYLKLDLITQLDFTIEDDPILWDIIQQYGVGNYEEAQRDLEEFSVLFN